MIMYRENQDVNTIVNSVICGTPQVSVEHEGIVHKIWSVSSAEVI